MLVLTTAVSVQIVTARLKDTCKANELMATSMLNQLSPTYEDVWQ